jgi:hypothetical protein
MRRAAACALLAVAVFAIAAARVVWSSRGEFLAANAAAGQGGADDELAHLGRAARLYAPGNPYSRRALDRLAEIGRHDPEHALAAWREARGAILATRSFYTPRRALLDEADAHLAQLMADAEHPLTADARARAERWHAARLADVSAPSLSWTLVALFGLGQWIGCAAGLFLRGIGDDDRLRRGPALAWGAGLALGLALFFIGLVRA